MPLTEQQLISLISRCEVKLENMTLKIDDKKDQRQLLLLYYQSLNEADLEAGRTSFIRRLNKMTREVNRLESIKGRHQQTLLVLMDEKQKMETEKESLRLAREIKISLAKRLVNRSRRLMRPEPGWILVERGIYRASV